MINKDLRLIYLYEFKRGTNATETARNINEAFGDKSAEVRTVQRWFARFRNGDESRLILRILQISHPQISIFLNTWTPS